jgi:hypothetical protein
MLNGKHFAIKQENEIMLLNFYTTRWVKAGNPRLAELAAVDLIKNDSTLKESVQNERDDPPMIYLEEIKEVSWLEFFRKNPGGGYTFYLDDENENPANQKMKADD